ncbi:MAG: OmpL47-type beta-barrel domain-containing protein, partial [Nitrososphaerales archaeon]
QNSDKIQVGNFKVTILYTDNIPPVTTITSATSGGVAVPNANGYYSKGTDITINFLATDVGSGVAYSECKLDTGTYQTCTSPKSYPGLADGSHTVSIRSTDYAGNVESTAIITWQQDTQLPVVTTSGAVTEQADQITGRLITYTASATDASPSSGLIGTAPSCGPIASGQVFPIADTTVTCTQADKSGNVGTTSFLVRILPYLDLGYVEEGVQSTITVSDPAVSGTIAVQATCPSGTSSVSLTQTTPGVFSAPILTTLSPTGLLGGIQNLQCGAFDGISVAYTIVRGTSTDSGVVQAAGSGASLGGIRALQFNSDAVPLGNNIGMSAKRIVGSTGCNLPGTAETLTVKVTSPSDPTNGINVILTEDAVNSCVFKTTENVWFVSGSSTNSPPAIQTAQGQTVTGTLLSISPTETTTVLILPAPPSIPSIGTATAVTSTTCSSDADKDGICNSPAWEGSGSSVLSITTSGITWQYTAAGGGCPRLLDDRNPSAGYPTDASNPVTCPSATVKDVFYEIDYMPNHKPSYAALLNVINAFRNAPSTCPTGLTCPGPIALHIKLDEQLPQHDNFIPWTTNGVQDSNNPMGGFDEIKRLYFMSPDERASSSSAAILKSERQVMRYMLISHQQEEASQILSSGYSEIKGNDAEVSLGAFSLG